MILADEIVALASIPAPTGAEDARIAWIERRIAHLPGARSRDAAGSLIWRFSSDRRELLVMAQVDTAFDADTPVSILRDGDQLAGQAMPHIPSDLAVAFTVGEEGLGNLRRALHTRVRDPWSARRGADRRGPLLGDHRANGPPRSSVCPMAWAPDRQTPMRPSALGIPAIALGCSRGSGVHTLQERIELGSLELGVRQVGEVIRALLA